jgi:hypothetical protein
MQAGRLRYSVLLSVHPSDTHHASLLIVWPKRFHPSRSQELKNILHTESGPASVQPEEVASILQNIQRDLKDYEVEIYWLEQLRQEKEQLEEYATLLQSLLSPLRKVPDEILLEIFDLCCDTNSFEIVGPMHRLPAIVISSVCSRWRSNALSMPAI